MLLLLNVSYLDGFQLLNNELFSCVDGFWLLDNALLFFATAKYTRENELAMSL